MEDREYLDKYTVQAALASAVEHILQTRPSDPLSAISEFLFSRLPPSVLAPGETTVGALHAEALPGGALESRLVRLGLDASRASGFAAAAKRLIEAGISPSTRASAFWVPGRIEVAGKHTDYAGGRSLLCAANRGFAVVSAEREDAVCRIFATFELTGEQAEAEVRLDASAGEPLPEGWALYPAVTARRLARNFGLRGGISLALSCDLAEASGMSSSSAVITLMFLALAARNKLGSSPELVRALPTAEQLAHYLGCIENGQDCGPSLPGDKGVGTFGGSEDHTAILLCGAGELRQYSFCPTRLEARVRMPPGLVFVLAVSGAVARKGAERLADYNNAALLAGWAATSAVEGGPAAERRADWAVRPTLASRPACKCSPRRPSFFSPQVAFNERPTLAAVTRAAAARLQMPPAAPAVKQAVMDSIIPADNGTHPSGCEAGALARRFDQFHTESEEVVPGLARALGGGEAAGAVDTAAIGTLVDLSQKLTASHLRNTLPETEWLPETARSLGALGASAFGAGFGGSVWALVEVGKAQSFAAEWEAAYVSAFPDRASLARFFVMATPAPGACSVV